MARGVICRRRQDDTCSNVVAQLVVPETLKDKVFKGINDDMRHFDIERPLDLAKSRFFWPKMSKEIRQRGKSFRAYVLRRSPQPHRVAPLVPITSSAPLQLVCHDRLLET